MTVCFLIFLLFKPRVFLEESSVPADPHRAGQIRWWGWGGWGRGWWRRRPHRWGDESGGEEESRETEAESETVHSAGGAAAEKPQAEGQSPLPLHRFPRLQGPISAPLLHSLTSCSYIATKRMPVYMSLMVTGSLRGEHHMFKGYSTSNDLISFHLLK